ncbi:MAG TPA: ABC transporter ATP-binding protein [Pyrinomonadaceae bacterium]|nr:ABC transporter ATP-binding protein [Pyrinomonadaceae bacterium]
MQSDLTLKQSTRIAGPDGLTNGPLIQTRDLSFAYSSSPAVVDVSLALPRGAVGALIGANGSGKSTLIRLLAGLLKPVQGEVHFNGASLTKLHPRERAKRIAYVPQSTSTVFPFTALEVVLTGRSPYSGRFRFESVHDEQIALAALAALDASHLSARHITELSGGERQLVTVARALAQEPEVMLLDEPASALDLKHRTQLARALRRLRDERGITVLMITHDLMLLDSVADLIFAMKCGRVVASGAPEMVLTDRVLGEVYDAPVRTIHSEGRTFVWSEL